MVEKERKWLKKKAKLSEPQLSLSERHRGTSKKNETLKADPITAEKS